MGNLYNFLACQAIMFYCEKLENFETKISKLQNFKTFIGMQKEEFAKCIYNIYIYSYR